MSVSPLSSHLVTDVRGLRQATRERPLPDAWKADGRVGSGHGRPRHAQPCRANSRWIPPSDLLLVSGGAAIGIVEVGSGPAALEPLFSRRVPLVGNFERLC